VEEYGYTSLQDKCCAPELVDLMPTRKERSAVGLHKQDQDCCQDGVLATIPRKSLKFDGEKGAEALLWGGVTLEKMKVDESLPPAPWWCTFNAMWELA
jgi:hypothetical protein